MRFKDLPNYAETVKFSRKYHYMERIGSKIFLEHQDTISWYNDITSAFNFLEKNPELEVSDAFYGQNFPFLSGLIYDLKTTKMGESHSETETHKVFIVYVNVHSLRDIPYGVRDPYEKALLESCDYSSTFARLDDISHLHNLKTERTKNGERHLYISCVHFCNKNFYFLTSRYQEIIDRFDMAELMAV